MARRSTSRSNRRTNSSKAARFPACASMTRDRSSSSDKEVTVASTASDPPDLPALSAKANVQWGSGIFAFSSYEAALSVHSLIVANKPDRRPNTQRCGVIQFGRTSALQVSSHLSYDIQRMSAAICFRGMKAFSAVNVGRLVTHFHPNFNPSRSARLLNYPVAHLSRSARPQTARSVIGPTPPHIPGPARDKKNLVDQASPRNPLATPESPAPGSIPADSTGPLL